MPKLSNLNQPIKLLNGTSIIDITGKTSLTIKNALVSVCEMHQSGIPGSGEHIMAYDIGAKLFKAKDEIELTDSELTFLKKLLNESRIYTSIVIGTLNKYLSELK